MKREVDAVLNGLVSEGVITGFEPEFDGISALGILHIAVAGKVITDSRNPGYDRPKAMAIRNRVIKDLEGELATEVMVSVRSSSPFVTRTASA